MGILELLAAMMLTLASLVQHGTNFVTVCYILSSSMNHWSTIVGVRSLFTQVPMIKQYCLYLCMVESLGFLEFDKNSFFNFIHFLVV